MEKESKKTSSKASAAKERRPKDKDKTKDKDKDKLKDDSKLHKLSLKGSSRLVAEFFQYSIHTILYEAHHSNEASTQPKILQRMKAIFHNAPDRREKKLTISKPQSQEIWPQHAQYIFTDSRIRGNPKLTFPCVLSVSADDQVKAYIKQIMSQLDKWMVGGKISKLVIVITDKDTGEHVERWQFDVQISAPPPRPKRKQSSDDEQQQQENSNSNSTLFADKDKPESEIQAEIAAIFRQITASVTFLPQLSSDCTFNVLVYADADSDVPVEWGDSDAKEIENGERVQLRGFSTANHRVDTIVSYRLGD
ncbi:hypothetical protein Trco_004632 [Trichoderma cornu-damae]|uniref:HORMA domain-containing protein n=1 Tax=Trichoderma cornu-damae TaxID=654480 RepID=A0A9P8TUG8_9HYPO|nr:hypothetical protein Trco_004632 [Trichoderma cornu-damae]